MRKKTTKNEKIFINIYIYISSILSILQNLRMLKKGNIYIYLYIYNKYRASWASYKIWGCWTPSIRSSISLPSMSMKDDTICNLENCRHSIFPYKRKRQVIIDFRVLCEIQRNHRINMHFKHFFIYIKNKFWLKWC